MSSIGPQLPPHLLAAAANAHASDDEDDSEGPSPGPSAPAAIGPAMPPPTMKPPAAPAPAPAAEVDSDDDYTPALPPGFSAQPPASRPAAGPARASSGRVVGPTMPHHSARHEDDDSEDEIGPSPVPVGPVVQRNAAAEFRAREESRRKALEDAAKPKKLERDEWMLKPPSASDLLSNIDTTKIIRGGRRFNASSKAPTADSKVGASSLWTETPAERQQRLMDEISGKRKRMENSGPETSRGEDLENAKRRRAEEDVRRGVDEYTRSKRGDSLIEQHSAATAATKPDTDGLPAAIWDHGRDMALSGRLMDDKQRDRIVKDSKGLGDRFGSGKGGSFL